MAKIKYLIIDTLTIEDTNAMAEKICLKVANLSVLKVKKEVLKLKGKDDELNAHKFNLNELLSLIAFYDVHTELKIKYVDTEFSEPVETPKEMKVSPVSEALAEQKKEVTLEIKNESILTAKEPVAEKAINSDELPDSPFEF